MIEKLVLQITSRPKLMGCLRIVGWVAVIVAIVLTNMIMKEQEISFVYNNF